jgi:hypothetical protein
MSSDHSDSTPRRSFPKPILSAFGSTGSLQRKTRTFLDKNFLANSHTPETPLKAERSKFIIPSNLSPFALSPKLLMARNIPLNKSTELKNETFLNSSFNSESFETTFINSPSHFSSSTLNDSLDFHMGDGIADQSFTTFPDIKSNFDSDYEIDSSSVSPSVAGEFVSETSHLFNEPWKSTKVNFLNDWSQSEEAFGMKHYF